MLDSHSRTSSSRRRPVTIQSGTRARQSGQGKVQRLVSECLDKGTEASGGNGMKCVHTSLAPPATHGITRSSRRSGMARRIRHTMCRCCAWHRLRISTGSTSAAAPRGRGAAAAAAAGGGRGESECFQAVASKSRCSAHREELSGAARHAPPTTQRPPPPTRLLSGHVAVHCLGQAVGHVGQLGHQGCHLLGAPPAAAGQQAARHRQQRRGGGMG